MGNNSIGKTIFVAVALCVFFSVIVSSAAVGLRPIQEKNRDLDKKKNILSAAGIKVDGEEAITEAFAKVQTLYVTIPSGDIVDLGENAQKKLNETVEIDPSVDVGSIGVRSKYLPVYLLKEGSTISKVVLPIISKGLWSTMHAFMALEGDADTIKGLEYYIQAETPGLGAEVTNPKWKAQWKGKKVYNGNDVGITVTKAGQAKSETYDVDGLSGATITSVGVANSLKYWLGEAGFAKFLAKVAGGKL